MNQDARALGQEINLNMPWEVKNHTVNIMMNIILGWSFWLLHKLGWKPLAQLMQSSDMTSICKSNILNVAHLSGTHIWLKLRIQKLLQSFYSSSVAASLSMPKFFSYKGIEGSAASHCRSWCILKEAPFTLKPDISNKWFWVPPYSETLRHNRLCCTKTGTAALHVSAYKHLRTWLELASPSCTNSWKKKKFSEN